MLYDSRRYQSGHNKDPSLSLKFPLKESVRLQNFNQNKKTRKRAFAGERNKTEKNREKVRSEEDSESLKVSDTESEQARDASDWQESSDVGSGLEAADQVLDLGGRGTEFLELQLSGSGWFRIPASSLNTSCPQIRPDRIQDTGHVV